jgi:hypothetical protein
MSNYVIEQILHKKKITDYLASKGIHPKGRESNGKLKYWCPIHQEKNSPSFIVYLNGEFENFYCYGCKAKYHIIHLYRDLEGVSTGDAIRALSGDLELSVDAEIAHAIAEIENDHSINAEYNPPQLALIIGRQLYDFTQRVEKDPYFVDAATKIEKIVDQAVDSVDFSTLKNLYENLPDTLLKAVRMYDERKEQKLLEASKCQQ